MFGVTPLLVEQKNIIKTLESLTFRYFAQIWRTTPTASLEVILNKKPAHFGSVEHSN